MGVGFAKDAENQNKKNSVLRNRLKEKYFLTQEYKVKSKKSLHFRDATAEEIHQIRKKMNKQKRAIRIKSVLVLLILFLLIAYLVFF